MDIFKLIAKLKLYVQRSLMYLSIINFLLLLGTFKKTYDIPINIIWFIIFGLCSSLLFGWLDYIFILKKEAILINEKNDVKDQLNRIERIINELKEKERS